MKNTMVIVAGSAAAIAVVLVLADRVLRADTEELLSELAEDRLHALEAVAVEVERDFAQVEDDLALSQFLLRTASTAIDRTRELRAIINNNREHRLARVYDRRGRLAFEVMSGRPPIAEQHRKRIRTEMDRIAREVIETDAEVSTTSDPIPLTEQEMLRISALGWSRGVVALAVDNGEILRPLRALAADRSTTLFLIRQDGSLELFADGAYVSPHAVDGIRAAITHDRTGVIRLGPDLAEQFGLERADAVAAFVLFGTGRATYVAVTVTSSSIIEEQQAMVVSRVATAAGAILLVIAGLGAWAFLVGRREISLREALRNAESIAHEREKAEKILESVPTLVVALSNEGRVTSVNAAFEQRVGTIVLGEELERAFPLADPASLQRVRALLDRARETHKPGTEFAPNMTLFGEEGQFSLYAAPLEHPQGETEMLLVIDDLTRLGVLESQLVRAEKLATVGVLSAGVAHEIGTPLGIARGRAEYVLSKLPPDDKNRSHLQLVLEQIDRVTRIIRQLLDFTRAKRPQTGNVELRAVVDQVTELLRFEIDRKELELDLALDPDLPPLRAEPDQLEQVVLNLLLNACQASDSGARITVKSSRDAIDPSFAVLSVEDRGCGIPSGLRSRVFDPFFTTKKRGQGTGLGLTIVHQIVTDHGGRIDLDSEEGQGTSVIVRWPLSAH